MRLLSAPMMVGLCLLLTAPVSAGAGETEMSVVYERTGGFVGLNQRLELDASAKTLAFTDRRTGAGKRALTDEEAKRLTALVEGVKGKPAPGQSGENARVSDSFTLRLWLGNSSEGTAAMTLSTLAVPVGKGEGSPWGELLAFVDGLVEAELDRRRPAGAPQILSPEDLEK